VPTAAYVVNMGLFINYGGSIMVNSEKSQLANPGKSNQDNSGFGTDLSMWPRVFARRTSRIFHMISYGNQ
jgi:hypothetical protein